MRENNKAIVMRVPQKIHDQIRKEAEVEKIPITKKAIQYLQKGMEKEGSKS